MTLDPQTLIDDATAAPSADALTEVAELAARQIALEDSIAETEALLKRQKAQLRQISEHDLPLALSSHGLSEISMADGSKVSTKEIVRASIPKDRRDEAYRWLDENGFGDLVNHKVTAEFGRGEDDQAQASIEALRGLGLDPEDTRSVHTSTLGAFVREQIAAGRDLPTDLLGVYIGHQTRITRAS